MRTHAQKYAEIERWRFALLAQLEAEQAIDSSPLAPEPPPEARAAARLLARALRKQQRNSDYQSYCKAQEQIRREKRTAA